jgi:hypothetical protein
MTRVSQPFGPKRLIVVLKSCFAILNGADEAVESVAVRPEPESNSLEIAETKGILAPTLKDHSASIVNGQQGRSKVLLVEDNIINLKVGASSACQCLQKLIH